MMTSEQAKKILTAIYSYHNPDKIRDIDNLLLKYKGEEDALVESVFQKYTVSEATRALYLNLEGEQTIEVAKNKKNRGRRLMALIFALTIGGLIMTLFFHNRYNATANFIDVPDGQNEPIKEVAEKMVIYLQVNYASEHNGKCPMQIKEYQFSKVENNRCDVSVKIFDAATNIPAILYLKIKKYEYGWAVDATDFFYDNKHNWEDESDAPYTEEKLDSLLKIYKHF